MVVLAPGAGAIMRVVQKGYANATEQTIWLATNARAPGQNYFKIQMFESTDSSSAPGALPNIAPADIDIAGEARGTVTYADMKLSPYFVQNQYGPFGYSMGRTETADICMYAWQRIGATNKRGTTGVRGTINLRALICDGSKSEHELLQIMFELRIKGVTGMATRAPSEIGAYGTVISPFSANVAANVLPAPVIAQSRKIPQQPQKVSEDITGSITPRQIVPVPSGPQSMPAVPMP